MREVGSDGVLTAPCFRNEGERHPPPFINDVAFDKGYGEVSLVQVSKVNCYRLPQDNR